MCDVQDLDEPPDWQRGPGRPTQTWHARQAAAQAEWHTLRTLARTVNCPPPPHGCDTPAGTDCPDLHKFPAHPARINNARKAQQ